MIRRILKSGFGGCICRRGKGKKHEAEAEREQQTEQLKLRFGESLQVSWELACTDFMIPSLTLQPLVENAVRYGVRGNEDGCGTVRILSRDCADHYEISVVDDGPGFSPGDKQGFDERTHVGIENVKERLRAVCNGEFRIQSAPGAGTQAIIILPKEKET